MFDDLIKKVTGGLDGIAEDLLKAAQGKIKERISEVFSIHKLEKLKANIVRVGKVKTILNPDSIVELNDIFIENAVSFGDKKYFQSVDTFGSKQVLIEGGAGQGKSLYLRHLCLNEGARGNYIPIFIEFRYLKYEKDLKKELFEAIRDFGVELNEDLFDYLAKSKKILFILDGFDEIPSLDRDRTAMELETIARTYPDLKIVISSRPDSGMGASVYFKKYKISYLKIEQQTGFIEHLYKNKQQAQDTIKILEESPFISGVTNTPLLLTLFTITYNSRHFKPDNLAEFYSLIFSTMLYRHDRMKIGYKRERKSNLTDGKMERIFEALSFISLKRNKTRFNSSEFHEYLGLALQNENLNENIIDKLIDDITQITALIVPDGYNNYSFSHKSIQEYFSAVFISKIDKEKRSKFYTAIIKNYSEFRTWQNVLLFLETIDEYSYKKLFLLPLKRKVLGLDENNKIIINYYSFLLLIGRDSKLSVDEEGNLQAAYWGDTFSDSVYKEYSAKVRDITLEYLRSKKKLIAEFIAFCNVEDYEIYQNNSYGDRPFIFSIDEGYDRHFVITISNLLKNTSLSKDICAYLSKKLEESSLIDEIINIEIELKNSERITNQIMDF